MPAPGVSYSPASDAVRLAGRWEPITLEGESEIEVGGHSYPLPVLASARVVQASRGIQILNVLHSGRVHVFAGGLQLAQTDAEAKSRAVRWRELPGTDL